jgi:hypothetical protein
MLPAGALMTEAAMRWVEGTPSAMYAARTPPATVEKPLVMTECSSEVRARQQVASTVKAGCLEEACAGLLQARAVSCMQVISMLRQAGWDVRGQERGDTRGGSGGQEGSN